MRACALRGVTPGPGGQNVAGRGSGRSGASWNVRIVYAGGSKDLAMSSLKFDAHIEGMLHADLVVDSARCASVRTVCISLCALFLSSHSAELAFGVTDARTYARTQTNTHSRSRSQPGHKGVALRRWHPGQYCTWRRRRDTTSARRTPLHSSAAPVTRCVYVYLGYAAIRNGALSVARCERHEPAAAADNLTFKRLKYSAGWGKR